MGLEIDIKDPKSNWNFNVVAVLEAGETVAQLSGTISTVGDFTLTAEFDQFDIADINNLFNHLFGEDLTAPHTDIQIGKAILTISKAGGFLLQVSDLRIGEHNSSEATVKFGSKGVVLTAALSGGVMNVGEFQISNANAQISFGRFAKQAKTDILFSGQLGWHGYVFDVGVHVYDSDDGKDTLEYTIYGTFRTPSGTPMTTFPLATLVPSPPGNFLGDITLTDAALIIASSDDPAFGALNHSGYPAKQGKQISQSMLVAIDVRTGIQVCASLVINSFNKISRDQHPSTLMLNAGWSTKGFSFDIVFYADTVLHLGRGVTTDPIKLQITSTPALKISAGALIPVEKSNTPLHFTLDMTLNEFGASATGELKGGWNNPFGISDKLTIEPVLALTLSIIYETFIEQGPSALGFVGNVKFGDVQGKIAFEVNDIPSSKSFDLKVDFCFA